MTLTTDQIKQAILCCIDPSANCANDCPVFMETRCKDRLLGATRKFFDGLESQPVEKTAEKTVSPRPNKTEYFLNIAREVAERSTCLRRKYGAVIVKDDVIVATGYNGAARGEPNCCDCGTCIREEQNIPHGERYELCKAVHAEANALLNGNRADMIDATLYLVGIDGDEEMAEPTPCAMCERLIRNARIKKVVTRKGEWTCKS